MSPHTLATCTVFILAGASLPAQERPVSEEVRQLARQYLETTDTATRTRSARQLDASPCDPESVVLSLRPRPPAEFEAGYTAEVQFDAGSKAK